MTDVLEATGRNSLGRKSPPLLVAFRLAVGLLQGAALWWLYDSASSGWGLCNLADESRCSGPSWPATIPELWGPLAMILVMVPILLLAGAGRMRPLTLALWALAATAFLALLGWHGVAAQSISEYGPRSHPPFLPWPMPLFAATALFIGHHLVLPGDLERRWVAAFPTYFDTAWKAGVQLALSIGFTGAFWLLLFLGAALFHVIGLDFLQDLLGEEWFAIPVTTLMFATAVHLTDVRDGLIRGVRSVVLMLLSWLLLLMTVLAAGFLTALPFTGLQGLWETGSATALVLSAAAALIILINTAYQDGRADNLPPLVLRVTVRVAAVLLTPLLIIAFWGLALRIGQHGLTPDRIIAFACALIGAAYAAGYGFAALSPLWRKGAGWMQPLERTNVATAVLEVVVILALFSPIADPARLSVADQLARLERGAVSPDQFDYAFLRFESGKTGEAALAKLARSDNDEIAGLAKSMQAEKHRYGVDLVDSLPAADDIRIRANPVGAVLPASFTDQYSSLREVLSGCVEGAPCEARMLDLDGDGATEVLVAARGALSVFKREADGRWFEWAEYVPPSCQEGSIDVAQALRANQFETAAPAFPDLILNGTRFRHQEGSPECDRDEPEAAASPRPAAQPPVVGESHGRLAPRGM
ncbi:DUF4153 domain-containing protein [Brevundimonas sp.]|uniref:DUF4153 domain-containing protein n=1 Tax=Brevundimonas sp. TaxID=1871086 RepID=UPI002D4C3472|nr:DUF4153 domain-containing protein [Brevundimonas sp.]HYD27862.1 DUF4153 domain-containing protein [Brevundimonas sp.]